MAGTSAHKRSAPDAAARFGFSPPPNVHPNYGACFKIRIPRTLAAHSALMQHEIVLEDAMQVDEPSISRKRSFQDMENGSVVKNILHASDVLGDSRSTTSGDSRVDFNPQDLGTYPPRRDEFLLFHSIKRRRGCTFTLQELETQEEFKVLPENEMRSLDGKQRPRPPEIGKRPPAVSLSIELFDSPEIDLKHPSIDIREANQRGERGVFARSKFYSSTGECCWAPCLLLDYDRQKETFLVEWNSNQKQKNVKRLNIILDRENERSFVIRVMSARDVREHVETRLRYSNYIETLPFKNPEILDDEWLRRFRYLAGWDLCQKFPTLVNSYLEDLKLDYRRNVNKSILDYRFLIDEEERSRFVALQIFPKEGYQSLVPMQGCVPLNYSFVQFFENLSRTLCVADEALLMGLQLYYKEMDISTISLVNPQLVTLPRPWKLEEFKAAEENHVKDVIDNFKNEWIPRVAGIIDELAPEVSKLSKDFIEMLLKFISRISMMMVEQLEEVVLRSIHEYKRIWQGYSGPEKSDNLPIPEMFAMSDQEIYTSKKQESWGIPMFKIKLTVEGGQFVFVPSLETIRETVLELYDNMILSVKGMEDLPSRLTSITSLLTTQDIETLESDDMRILETRQLIEVLCPPWLLWFWFHV